jgi:hypothetical protein
MATLKTDPYRDRLIRKIDKLELNGDIVALLTVYTKDIFEFKVISIAGVEYKVYGKNDLSGKGVKVFSPGVTSEEIVDEFEIDLYLRFEFLDQCRYVSPSEFPLKLDTFYDKKIDIDTEKKLAAELRELYSKYNIKNRFDSINFDFDTKKKLAAELRELYTKYNIPVDIIKLDI